MDSFTDLHGAADIPETPFRISFKIHELYEKCIVTKRLSHYNPKQQAEKRQQSDIK